MTDITTTTKAPRKAKAAATPKPGATGRPAKGLKPTKEPTPVQSPKPEGHATTPKVPSKIDQVLALLRREEGATTKALMEATGWQAHSVRGIIAGAIKKKLGLSVVSEAGESGRTYRIITAGVSA